MARQSRPVVAGLPMHVVQRGNNRTPCFISDSDYLFYLEQLSELIGEFECEVHAYVLMTNHVHLLVTPRRENSLANIMKRLGQRHAQRFNRIHERTGTLWEGRYRSNIVDADRWLLACYRYIEMNPVRAGLVEHPADYRWSSHRSNALGARLDWLAPHPVFQALAENPLARRAAYRALFEISDDAASLTAVRAVLRGKPTGTDPVRGLSPIVTSLRRGA